MRRGDFGVGADPGPSGERKDEGTDRDRGQHRRPRNDVAQCAKPVGRGQVDTDLLGCLPDGRFHQIGVLRAPAAARQADLAGPGITGPFGPADEKDRIGIRREDQGDGGPPPIRLGGLDRLVPGEAFGDSGQRRGKRVGQWLCEWQEPPQQPPGGGPSLLKSAGLPAVAGRAGSDIRRSTFRSLHWGHLTVVPFRTSRSKSEPQEGQW